MTGTPCPKCGQPHPRCSAHAKTTGLPCMAQPAAGATVCKAHGGGSPNARRGAAQRRATAAAEADAKAVLAHHGRPTELNVLEEWTKLIVEALALKDSLAQRVNALGERIRYEAVGAGTEQLRGELAAYERALDRTERFLSSYSKHNLDERRVQLAEDEAQLIAGHIGALLSAFLGGIVQLLAANPDEDPVDVIETGWPHLTSTHVPAFLRALDTQGA